MTGCGGSSSGTPASTSEQSTAETEQSSAQASVNTDAIKGEIETALSDFEISEVAVETLKSGNVEVYIHFQTNDYEAEYQPFLEAAIPAVVTSADKAGATVSSVIAYGEASEDDFLFWSTNDGNTGQIVDNREGHTGVTPNVPLENVTDYLKGIYPPEEEKVEPAIGMTESEVYASTWGTPKKRNKTETTNGTREQWVYDEGYIYFENGYVTSIQK